MSKHHVHIHGEHCGDHAHGHHHHIPAGSDGSRLAIAFAIILVFMVVEIIGGIVSGSLALLADAGHMATDAAALLLALSARWLAGRTARSDVFPYGLRRAQVLAGFVNAVALIALTGWLIWEAIQRFIDPQPIMSTTMLYVAIAGLIANIAAFAVLHGGNRKDLNLRGALIHVIGDIFGSIAAIASAVIIALTGFYRVDPLLTFLVSALILRVAWPLLAEASHVLLQGAPSDVDTDTIARTLTNHVDGVQGVHQMKVWMLTPEEPQLAMHLAVTDPSVASDVLSEVKEILRDRFGIASSTIQVECKGCPDKLAADPVSGAARNTQGSSQGSAASNDDTDGAASAPVMRAG